MISLLEYLDKAPSSLLQKIYQRFKSGSGLVSNAQVREKVLEWAMSKERISQTLEQWTADEILWLKQLYLSGVQGWNSEKMARIVAAGDRFRVTPWLDRVAWEFLGARIRHPQLHWVGFKEISEIIMSLPQPNSTVECELEFTDYGNFFALHFYRLAAFAKLAKIKLNQSGDLNQKSRKSLADTFWSKPNLGGSAPDLELDLLLSLFECNGYLNKSDSLLGLETDFEDCALDFEEMFPSLLHHWLLTQKLESTWLHLVLGMVQSPINSLQIAQILGYKGIADELPSFEQLPKILKEMYFLGLISIARQAGKVHYIALARRGLRILNRELSSEMQGVFATPNFEVHLPCTSVGMVHFYLECMAGLEKEGPMLKYVLKKDLFYDAMKQPQNLSKISDFLSRLNLPPVVSSATSEWLLLTSSIQSHDVLWISIENADLRSKIFALPEIQSLALGIDPNRGFSVVSKYFDQVKILLSTFGLQILGSQPKPSSHKQHNTLGVSHFGEIQFDYQHHEPREAVELQLSDSFVFGRHSRELDFGQRLRVLEYAILNDQAVELMDAKGVVYDVFLPVRILKQTNPIRVEGYVSGAESLSELEVALIPSLRLM